MGPYTVDLISGTSYPVKVTTERGNIFTTNSGTIYYEDGTWYTTSLGISVNINNNKGKFEIEIYDDEDFLVGYYKTLGEDEGDLEKYFEVSYPGTYTVYVSEFTGKNWVPLDNTPAEVQILWPGGTPIVFLYLIGLPP